MIRLPESLAAWSSPDFEDALRREVEGLGLEALPLQQSLSSSSVALEGYRVMVIGADEVRGAIRARLGIFYEGIVAGCGCGVIAEPQSEYCELELSIDKATAEAVVRVV